MSFYEFLSQYYDSLFPAGQETLAFLADHLTPGAKVLDLACGTGTHALALAEKGLSVAGMDLDEKMIELAKRKDKRSMCQFAAADMLEAARVFEAGYDLIYCIGNSLVHLDSVGLVVNLISTVFSLLREGGVFATQIINFDRITGSRTGSRMGPQSGPHKLPSIILEKEGIEFHRRYTFGQGDAKVQFETDLHLVEQGNNYHNSIPLLAMESDTLTGIVESAGFAVYELFGNFKREPHSGESFMTVVRAYKK